MDGGLAVALIRSARGGVALRHHRESETGESNGENQFGGDGHRKISLEIVGFVANKGI
jgi:hypothetical protein